MANIKIYQDRLNHIIKKGEVAEKEREEFIKSLLLKGLFVEDNKVRANTKN